MRPSVEETREVELLVMPKANSRGRRQARRSQLDPEVDGAADSAVVWSEVDVVSVGPCERLVDEVVAAVVGVGAVVQGF